MFRELDSRSAAGVCIASRPCDTRLNVETSSLKDIWASRKAGILASRVAWLRG